MGLEICKALLHMLEVTPFFFLAFSPNERQIFHLHVRRDTTGASVVGLSLSGDCYNASQPKPLSITDHCPSQTIVHHRPLYITDLTNLNYSFQDSW